jgi:hypothetical protein
MPPDNQSRPPKGNVKRYPKIKKLKGLVIQRVEGLDTFLVAQRTELDGIKESEKGKSVLIVTYNHDHPRTIVVESVEDQKRMIGVVCPTTYIFAKPKMPLSNFSGPLADHIYTLRYVNPRFFDNMSMIDTKGEKEECGFLALRLFGFSTAYVLYVYSRYEEGKQSTDKSMFCTVLCIVLCMVLCMVHRMVHGKIEHICTALHTSCIQHVRGR